MNLTFIQWLQKIKITSKKFTLYQSYWKLYVIFYYYITMPHFVWIVVIQRCGTIALLEVLTVLEIRISIKFLYWWPILSYITGTREMVASIGRILSIPKVKNGLAWTWIGSIHLVLRTDWSPFTMNCCPNPWLFWRLF